MTWRAAGEKDGRMSEWMKRTANGAEHEMLKREGESRLGRIIQASPTYGQADPAVYFLRTAGAGFLKIGTLLRLSALQRRIDVVQTGCPYEVKLLYTLNGAGRHEEYRLHKAFDALRARAEWFRIEGELLQLVSMAEKEPDALSSWLWNKIQC